MTYDVFINCCGTEMVLCDLYFSRFNLTKDFYFTISSLLFVTNNVDVITEYLEKD